jgi:hypothetical protein
MNSKIGNFFGRTVGSTQAILAGASAYCPERQTPNFVQKEDVANSNKHRKHQHQLRNHAIASLEMLSPSRLGWRRITSSVTLIITETSCCVNMRKKESSTSEEAN